LEQTCQCIHSSTLFNPRATTRKWTLLFRNVKDAKIFAMDIGGSLTKIAYYSSLPCKKIIYDGESEVQYEVSEGARLHFIKFETKHIDSCLEYIGKSLVSSANRELGQDIKVCAIHEKMTLRMW
jgi:pantothenate kinase